MEPITARKEEVLAKLQENRSRHRTVFEAALDGWKKDTIRLLEQEVKSLESGRKRDVTFRAPAPEDHTLDYDRAIQMLKLDTGDTVQLDEVTFAQLVMDDWGWKRQWVRFSDRYAHGATASAYGDVEDF